MYMSRGDDPKVRERCLEQIKERVIAIEDECLPWSPFVIFPEGTTSNGTHILKFKRGAFASMRTVKPCYFTINDGHVVNASWDVI